MFLQESTDERQYALKHFCHLIRTIVQCKCTPIVYMSPFEPGRSDTSVRFNV